ncbi:MAG: efflux RND transporter periplasmic adaptor subunit [Gammaproteobacteria bacterium]|nr:efflux RND transporter periplasmic adaptor subunit [Gammaproteobacteria bacterium]
MTEPQALPPSSDPPPPSRRRRPWLWPVVVVLLLALILVAVHRWRGGAARFGRGPLGPKGPVPVEVATVRRGDVPIWIPALGTITPFATVTVHPQVSGELERIGFAEGETVHTGEFLAQVDPRPFEAALALARASLDRDAALLANARRDLARYRALITRNAVSRQQLDTQKALVDQAIGTVEGDRAQVRTAELNVNYAHIVAPITGRVGLRQVDAGNYVTPGDANGIVVITQMRPISAIFAIPEDDVDGVLEAMHGGRKLEVDVYDRSGDTRLATGVLLTVDNQIDPATGTVKLRASFANRHERLFPNQFVNVRLLEKVLHGQVLIPDTAVQRGAPKGVPGTFVYVVDAHRRVSVRPIVLGPASDHEVVATQGLVPGMRVVTEGGDRLRDGATVQWRGAGS